MALDTRLIGFWDVTEFAKGNYVEITPSGKYFIHERFFTYTVSEDGMTLTVQAPAGPEVLNREGNNTFSLKGRWTKYHVEDDIRETIIYNDDGSYVGFWGEESGDDYFFGFYVIEDGKLKTIEFRADVRTEGDIFISKTPEGEHSNGYIFETTDVCKFFNLSTNQLAFTFTRRL